MKLNNNSIKVITLYVILIAGVFWLKTGLLGENIKYFSGPLLILLGIWNVYEIYYSSKSKKIIYYSLFIFIIGWLVEYIGVKTGIIFGKYLYSNILQPQVLDVPIAIGFAWLTVVISSMAMVSYFVKSNFKFYNLLAPILVLLFDIILEPAAIKLDYWQWEGSQIPLQNYLAWFCLGLFFVLSKKFFSLNSIKFPLITKHFYISQIIYLFFVYIV